MYLKVISGGDPVKIDEVCKKFEISKSVLLKIEQAGYFDEVRKINGSIDYQDHDIEKLGLILALKKLGLSARMISKLLEKKNQNEQLLVLKQQRQKILDDIHLQQKNLDMIDYFIYRLKNEGDLYGSK